MRRLISTIRSLSTLLLFTVILGFSSTSTGYAKKLFIKEKEPVFLSVPENGSLVYIIRDKLYDMKKEQYVALDGIPIAFMPKNSYVAFKATPGWHLLTISPKKFDRYESFEFYCKPGETIVFHLNAMDAVTKKDEDEEKPNQPIELEYHRYYTTLTKYPLEYLSNIIEHDKLLFHRITEDGIKAAAKHLDAATKTRNKRIDDQPLTFKEAVAAHEISVEPPKDYPGFSFKAAQFPADKKKPYSWWEGDLYADSTALIFDFTDKQKKSRAKKEESTDSLRVPFEDLIAIEYFERKEYFDPNTIKLTYLGSGDTLQSLFSLDYTTAEDRYVTVEDTVLFVFERTHDEEKRDCLADQYKEKAIELHTSRGFSYDHPRCAAEIVEWLRRKAGQAQLTGVVAPLDEAVETDVDLEGDAVEPTGETVTPVGE